MSRIDNLRQERSSVPTIQMQINRMQGYVCFFEGRNDILFYLKTIKDKILNINCNRFDCGGKTTVLELLQNLQFKANLKPLFFIDKDFDDYLEKKITDDALFITEGYSFENYLVTPEALSELLEFHFLIEKNSDIYINILTQYQQAYQNFIDFIKPFMKWCIECEKNDNPITFFSLEYQYQNKPLIKIDNDFSVSFVQPQDFEIIFKQQSRTENAIINQTIDDLDKNDHNKWVHGKYALDFMMLFYKKITKHHKPTNIKQNNEALIEFLSPRISIPATLDAFLSRHILPQETPLK